MMRMFPSDDEEEQKIFFIFAIVDRAEKL